MLAFALISVKHFYGVVNFLFLLPNIKKLSNMSFSSCRPAKLELGCWPDHAVLLKCPSAEEV